MAPRGYCIVGPEIAGSPVATAVAVAVAVEAAFREVIVFLPGSGATWSSY